MYSIMGPSSNKALGKTRLRGGSGRWRVLVVSTIIAVFWNIHVSTHLTISISATGGGYHDEAPQHSKNRVASILSRFDDNQSKKSLALFNNNDNNNTDDRPFLVVCQNVDKNALYPTFANFTVVRLNLNERLPPWNATVFLHGEQCTGHPYVKESMERRKKSSFVVAPSLNLTTIESSDDLGSAWVHGVHWPDFGRNYYLREIRDRPAILKVYGEVFWRNAYKDGDCQDVDFVVYRENENPPSGCLTIHFLQGVTTTTLRGEDDFGLRQTADILKGTVSHPHKRNNVSEYDNFCSFIVRYNSSQPVDMFNHTYYDTDAFVRHMFFLQLSEYKPCTRITDCGGNPYVAFKCMVGYKFHITMENTLVDGYITEKLFNGALGGGIPVYFGATDIGNYVNTKSLIHCTIKRDIIEEMRSFYPRRGRPRPFLFNHTSTWPTDSELLEWADGYLRPQLEPCIKRVIELDNNDEEYKKVLSEPFITDDGIMNGMYPFRGVALAYNLLRHSENTSDFVTVSR